MGGRGELSQSSEPRAAQTREELLLEQSRGQQQPLTLAPQSLSIPGPASSPVLSSHALALPGCCSPLKAQRRGPRLYLAAPQPLLPPAQPLYRPRPQYELNFLAAEGRESSAALSFSPHHRLIPPPSLPDIHLSKESVLEAAQLLISAAPKLLSPSNGYLLRSPQPKAARPWHAYLLCPAAPHPSNAPLKQPLCIFQHFLFGC